MFYIHDNIWYGISKGKYTLPRLMNNKFPKEKKNKSKKEKDKKANNLARGLHG